MRSLAGVREPNLFIMKMQSTISGQEKVLEIVVLVGALVGLGGQGKQTDDTRKSLLVCSEAKLEINAR